MKINLSLIVRSCVSTVLCRIYLSFCVVFAFCSFGELNAAEKILFDSSWKFHLGDVGDEACLLGYDDRGWRSLDLPHDWSIEGDYAQFSNGTDWQSGFLPAGLGWYRKSFDLPAEWKGKTVRIQFDGIYLNSEVWINGHYLGKQPNGYVGFAYDLSPYLKDTGNCVAVKVDHTKPLTGRWYTGSGIYRHVYLLVSDKTYIPYSGVYFKVDSFVGDKAYASVQIAIGGEKRIPLQVMAGLRDSDGRMIAEYSSLISNVADSSCELKLKVDNPKRWSPEAPVVYTLVCRLKEGGRVVDEDKQSVGFRSLRFDAESGFSLNGKNVKLKGVCDHHTAGAVGAAVPDDILYYRLRLLKDMGCNAIRTAHNPFSPDFYTICDTLGIFVLNEGLDGWETPKARDDYGHYFTEYWKTDMTAFIKRDRNHPSVIMWSIGNEVSQASPETQAKLVGLFHALDPERPVTQGGVDPTRGMSADYGKNFSALDVIGFNGNGEEVGEFEAFRKKYPGLCAVGTELPHTYQTRGVYRTKTQWRLRDFPAPWERNREQNWELYEKRVFPIPDLSEEECFPEESVYPYYQSSYDNASVRISIRESWKRACSFPWLMGMFRWGSFDYLGEAEWPQRCGNFGVIDVAGIPKDAYYLYQSLWNDKPMVHIFPHWTHTGKEGKKIPVVVYSNCDSVELFLNNVSLGMLPNQGEQLVWKVPYQAGKIEAIGRQGGQIIATTHQQTALEPYTISFAFDKKEIKADSNEVIRVEVNVVDQKGVNCPNADDPLTFELKGPVRLLGVDNGDPVDLFSYRRPFCKSFRGKCVVLLQAKKIPGDAEMIVRSGNLKSNHLRIKIK